MIMPLWFWIFLSLYILAGAGVGLGLCVIATQKKSYSPSGLALGFLIFVLFWPAFFMAVLTEKILTT